MIVTRLVGLYFVIGMLDGRPVDPSMVKETPDRNWDYLVKYGYVSPELASLSPTKEDYSKGIKNFAEDLGESEINQEKLSELMRAPRCSKSTSDLIERTRRRRGKRFVAHISKWEQRDIRWRFRDPYEIFQKQTDFDIAKETLAHAFSMWSLASKYALRFYDVSKQSSTNETDLDIDTFFAAGDHGDHEPFDGKGGIVAHSGYPPEGKIHFDASENWMINGEKGIDLRYVTLHETGHALGLRHSKHKNAIMHPIYRTKGHEIALSDDDIKGIRYLYPQDRTAHEIYSKQMTKERTLSENGKKSAPIDFEEY